MIIPNRPALAALLCLVVPLYAHAAEKPLSVSGIYPHLAVFNDHGECGIGAVVPWAGRLWMITYPPHFRTGSNDKLYEINDRLEMTIRPQSVGGTHANRMIHRESNQLVIGPHFIDAEGNVRTADVKGALVGRMTATARHLIDPANKVYFFDMEGPVYEADVRSLDVKRLFVKPVPGWHGKGAYTGQGVLVIANNGEAQGGGIEKLPFESDPRSWSKGPEDAGALAEWDGNRWNVILRRQFTEVTGPGGILPDEDPGAPIWATGWDKRSVILAVRDKGAWFFYRLPKASHTFDPRHGWFTEWPRIREIAPGRLMMVMHGMMFDFPRTFRPGHTGGIRPIASHLRYIPDFCHWNGKVILAADDTSIMQNPLAGISQSNVWFGTTEELKTFGPPAGWGGVWMGDHVKANQPSDPYLLAGFEKRVLHLSHQADSEVAFTLEVDEGGGGEWMAVETVKVPAKAYRPHVLAAGLKGEWVRIKADRDCQVSAYFHYLTPVRAGGPDPAFDSLSREPVAAVVRPGKQKQLQFLDASSGAYYEVDEELGFRRVEDAGRVAEMQRLAPGALAAEYKIEQGPASMIVSGRGGRFHLPMAHGQKLRADSRLVREVASERELANIGGIFYEIPRGPDWLRIKPVASHPYAVADFCTWRGLLVLAGTRADAMPDGHFFKSADNATGLWFGKTDDLWKLGKPVGQGGPWHDTPVQPHIPSDPFLMTNFDRKTLSLSHDASAPITFTIQVNFMNNDTWRTYRKVTAPPGQTIRHPFPDGYQAHWVRLNADRACRATAILTYQ